MTDVAAKQPDPPHPDAILTAHELIRGERARHYGPPHDNFEVIAQLWGAYLRPRVNKLLAQAAGPPAFTSTGPGVELLDGNDVCNLMTLLKIAREATGNGYHEDSTVDVIGYQGIKQVLHDLTRDEFMKEIVAKDPGPGTTAEERSHLSNGGTEVP